MEKKEKLQIEVEIPSRKLHVEHVYCPEGHALCDPAKKIHGFPAIKTRVRHNGREGFLYMDPVYGSYDNLEEGITIPEGAIVELFCPECGATLKSKEETCQLCASPMYLFNLPKGGIIEGCLKKGCMYHKMKIVDAEQQVGRLFENHTLESYL